MGDPLLKQVQQDNRGPWFTLPAAALQGYQGRSPWLVGAQAPRVVVRITGSQLSARSYQRLAPRL